MKVVYKKNIFEKVIEAKKKAEREGMFIDYIELSLKEWGEAMHPFRDYSPGAKAMLSGVKIILADE